MEEKMAKNRESVPKISEPKSKMKSVERVVLSTEVIGRIDQWISQVKNKHPALRLSRTAIANYILTTHCSELSKSELDHLKLSNFNAARYTKWVDKIVQEAAKRGENMTPDDLLRLYAQCQDGSAPPEQG